MHPEPQDVNGSAVGAGHRMVSHLMQLFSVTGSAKQPPVAAVPVPEHPLDPLTADEVTTAAAACKELAARKGHPQVRFNAISLQEPGKAALLQYEANPASASVPRHAFCILQLPTASTVIEAVVELGEGEPVVVGWTELQGVQPMVTVEDCIEAEAVVKADAGLQELLHSRYGIQDMDMVALDPWYYGDRFDSPGAQFTDGRFIQCFMYMRMGARDNHYAHPLDLVVFVDMISRHVVKIFMHDNPPRVPHVNAPIVAPLVEAERGFRTGLKPLNVVQPEGPSFDVQGNVISWQKWSMRVSFNYREGLVLHNVGYHDQGRVRPIMHRAAMAEIIVPYADPREPFARKCAFDVVDYGLGFSANSLELGCDCLGHIKYFDAILNNAKGEPLVIKKAVCLHEEDHGILWKHVEYRDNHSEVRRSRRLVLSFVATIANYEYGFFWYFYQDGTIQYEVKLTGCLSTNGLSLDELESGKPTHGTLLSEGLNAQIHQHFFCARLDMAVDDPHGGANLVVTEVNCEPMGATRDNPYHVGFVAKETLLATEQQAQRRVDPAASRVWKIKNLNSLNTRSGAPVAWKLMAAPSPPLYAQLNSSHAKRGAFATKNLWVTPYHDDERFPAGMYPFQTSGSRGIADWTQQNRNVANADCVIWHSFGVTHIPRTEDWPVMPVETVGFHLKPINFFDINPGMDVPPLQNHASREAPAGAACGSCAAGVQGAAFVKPCRAHGTHHCTECSVREPDGPRVREHVPVSKL